MAELSERFAELMARLAKSDAELFRTIGAQNASVREMVDELTLSAPASAPKLSVQPALAPKALLTAEACALPALKARFGRVADAQAWAEERLGPAPRKPTWAELEQTFRTGSWPVKTTRRTAAATNLQQQLLQRMDRMEQQLGQRLEAVEQTLRALVEHGSR